MSPLHDELRVAMRRQADQLSEVPEVLAGIDRRARSIHRRRLAGAVAGSALAVCAVAVGVPVLTHAGHQRTADRLAHHNRHDATLPVTPEPSASRPPAPTQSLTSGPVRWGFHGDPTVREQVAPAATAAMHAWFADEQAARTDHGQPAIVPAADAPTVLFAGTDDRGRRLALMVTPVTGDGPGTYVAAVYVTDMGDPSSGSLASVHDVAADATQVSAVIPPPAGHPGTSAALVVGALGSGALTYAPDGHNFTSVDGWAGTQQGQDWWLFRRIIAPGSSVVPQIRLTSGGDGALRYQGPIGRGVNFPDV